VAVFIQEADVVSKQNPVHGLDGLWAIIDTDDQGLIILEGRPAIFETEDAARRARLRTSRPARASVHQVDQLILGGRLNWEADKHNPTITQNPPITVIPRPAHEQA